MRLTVDGHHVSIRVVATAAIAALLVSGCSVSFERPPSGPLPPVSGRPPAESAPADPAVVVRREENQAAVALLEQSRSQSAAGDFGSAAVTVERALAIDPNSAALWVELAEIRWRQGDRDQADALARKALTLAGADRSIVERAERLLQRR